MEKFTFKVEDTNYVSSFAPVPEWMSDEAIKTLNQGYLLPGECPRDLYYRVACQAARLLNKPEIMKDIFDILNLGFLGLSTPVASNFGSNKALPIACYANSVNDSIPSIYSHLKELAMMSKNGGGVASFYGNVRGAGSSITGGGISTGVVPVVQQYDKCASYVTQSNTRRGALAHYLPIEHPDAYELMLAKDHLNGDPRKMIDGNIAFTITDAFMEKVLKGDKEATKLFGKALETNLKVGSPYFLFIDNINRANPPAYVNHNLKVETSNLCSEITLFTDEGHSFVCCLSSLNLAKWDLWKDWKSSNTGKSVVELSVYLLDSVLEEFIKRAKPMVGMGRAVRSAEKGRALGLGTMGLHYLYQLKNLPFKSHEARALNIEIHKHINEQALKAGRDLAIEYGEPEWCRGTGLRNTHYLATAPTRTNSVITGAFSAGIEPIDSNAYTAKQAKGSFTRKNPLLIKLLQEKGLDNLDTWEHILQNNGSVLYLDSLTINEKLVFLTAREIDQEELIRQAADRAPYICQGQSLNRFVHPNIPLKQLSELVFKAWKSGVKGTYYTKSSSEQVLAKVKNKATIITKDNCPYCDKAKALFTELNIEYTEYKKDTVDYFPWKTVPQIWYEGHFIGGYSELLEYTAKINNNNLTQLKTNLSKMTYNDNNTLEDDKYKECEACTG